MRQRGNRGTRTLLADIIARAGRKSVSQRTQGSGGDGEPVGTTGTTTEIRNFTFSADTMLDHARSMFEYHAGQRLNSIRYYLVAFSLLANAYVVLEAIDGKSELLYIQTIIVSGLAFVVTISFWGLDIRNSALVEVDELALEELEGHAAITHNSQFPSNVGGTAVLLARKGSRPFNIAKNARLIGGLIQYKYVMNFLFLVLAIVSLFALACAISRYVQFVPKV